MSRSNGPRLWRCWRRRARGSQARAPGSRRSWSTGRSTPRRAASRCARDRPAMAAPLRPPPSSSPTASATSARGRTASMSATPKTGVRRQATRDDVEGMAALCERLGNIDFVMSMGLPADAPAEKGDLAQFAAMLSGTRKPLVTTAHGGRSLERMAAMAELCGERQSFACYAMPNPPLVHSAEALDKLAACARLGVPMIYAPAPAAGTTAPASITATIVVGNAETLSGLVVHQFGRRRRAVRLWRGLRRLRYAHGGRCVRRAGALPRQCRRLRPGALLRPAQLRLRGGRRRQRLRRAVGGRGRHHHRAGSALASHAAPRRRLSGVGHAELLRDDRARQRAGRVRARPAGRGRGRRGVGGPRRDRGGGPGRQPPRPSVHAAPPPVFLDADALRPDGLRSLAGIRGDDAQGACAGAVRRHFARSRGPSASTRRCGRVSRRRWQKSKGARCDGRALQPPGRAGLEHARDTPDRAGRAASRDGRARRRRHRAAARRCAGVPRAGRHRHAGGAGEGGADRRGGDGRRGRKDAAGERMPRGERTLRGTDAGEGGRVKLPAALVEELVARAPRVVHPRGSRAGARSQRGRRPAVCWQPEVWRPGCARRPATCAPRPRPILPRPAPWPTTSARWGSFAAHRCCLPASGCRRRCGPA